MMHNTLNMLVVRARQDVLFNGYESLQSPLSGSRYPHARALVADSGLQIGDLGYKFVFTDLPPATVTKQFQQFRKGAGLGSADVPEIFAPSNTKSIPYGKYQMLPANQSGGSAMVHMAFHHNRVEAVAIKKIRRSWRNARAVDEEIHMLQKLNHVRYYLQFRPLLHLLTS